MILDTNFIIDFFKNRENAVEKASELNERGETLFMTSVTVFELWHALDIKNKEKREKLEKFIGIFDLLVLDRESAKKGGEIHMDLRLKGSPIDPEDSMIAGVAIKNNQAILTRDEHFSRIGGVKIETY